MKKIEKPFWVDDKNLERIKLGDLADDVPFISQFVKENNYYKNKITITYEVPERKIEITESQFDEIKAKKDFIPWGELKKELFGEVE